MDNLLPATFLELLAGALAVVAICAGLGSLVSDLRVHLLKLLAILIICALALFSNSVTTYFVAIFVIATAVTELDFLQNLAAIIRGNKEYFDYRKEQLTKERRLGALATEVKETDIVSSALSDEKEESCPPDEERNTILELKKGEGGTVVVNPAPRAGGGPIVGVTGSADVVRDEVTAEKPEESIAVIKRPISEFAKGAVTPKVKRIFEYESKALDSLEIFYGRAIERGVRLVSNSGAQVELDGLLVSKAHPDTVFEIKYLSSSKNFISWIGLVSLQLNRTRTLYREITRKRPVIHFVLVLEDGVNLTTRQREEMANMSADTYSIFTPSILGFRS